MCIRDSLLGQQKNSGIIGILTGGGDVPGLNPAIRAVTIRALREGYKVIGIKRGWGGLIDIVRDPQYDNSGNFFELTEEIVNKAGRTGGTFLHTSRTRASHVPKANVPKHLQDKYTDEINDLTPEVLKNLEFMGIDYLIPIGGDDTLSYAVRLSKERVKVVAIPKTMDNDVPGTDYCIGFSTCITRTTVSYTHLKDGLVVTPSNTPRSFASRIWSRFAVSIKNFIFYLVLLFNFNITDKITNNICNPIIFSYKVYAISPKSIQATSKVNTTLNACAPKKAYVERR